MTFAAASFARQLAAEGKPAQEIFDIIYRTCFALTLEEAFETVVSWNLFQIAWKKAAAK